MKIDAFALDPNFTQAELDQKLNALYVDLLDFSQIACLDGRMFGVRTSCDTCEFEMNACVRNHAVHALISTQELAEEELGFNLTRRYHVEEIDWPGDAVIQTQWPGIAAIDVRQEFSSIDAFGPFAVSPYVEEDVLLADSGSGYCIATVDRTVVDNPSKITFRDDNGKVYPTQEIDGYPRRNEDGNWEIALGKTPAAPACETTLHAQHCHYMYVDTPITDECEDGTIVPVYPESNQIIPQARARQVVGENWRWWFYAWSLVDAAFAAEEVNLQRGQFYKLLQEIEFKCVTEVEAFPVVTWQKWDCETESWVHTEETLTLDSEVENKKYGFILINTGDIDCAADKGRLIKVRYSYKTDPAVINRTGGLFSLREAIAYHAAATLPLSSCGCEISETQRGFIPDAQKAYTDVRVNHISGETIYVLKFGNLYGQLVFGERLSQISPYEKLALL